MTRKVTIALDAMGGDRGPLVVVPAALAILERDDSVNLVLVGLPEVLAQAGNEAKGRYGSRLSFKPASQVVEMDEPPADALRHKKDSSLRVALELLKAGEADACVSSGNTGALMATARYVLKTLPGIDRPAIISAVPGLKGRTFMLDIGANVGCTAEHLLQFALMGSVIAADILEIDRRRAAHVFRILRNTGDLWDALARGHRLGGVDCFVPGSRLVSLSAKRCGPGTRFRTNGGCAARGYPPRVAGRYAHGAGGGCTTLGGRGYPPPERL
jgi:hypothetical protein